MASQLQRWQVLQGESCAITVPSTWEVSLGSGIGTVITASGDGHLLRVERVLAGLIPVEDLASHVSFESKRLLAGYEPAEASGLSVIGAGPALIRTAVTYEADGKSYIMRELFAEGLDQHMWYVRVSASRSTFDAALADKILHSFEIDFLQGVDDGTDTDR